MPSHQRHEVSLCAISSCATSAQLISPGGHLGSNAWGVPAPTSTLSARSFSASPTVFKSPSCVCSELGGDFHLASFGTSHQSTVCQMETQEEEILCKRQMSSQPSSCSLLLVLALRLFSCPRLCIRHSPHGSLIYWQVQGPKGAPHHKAKHVLSSLHVPAGRWVSALHIIYFL